MDTNQTKLTKVRPKKGVITSKSEECKLCSSVSTWHPVVRTLKRAFDATHVPAQGTLKLTSPYSHISMRTFSSKDEWRNKRSKNVIFETTDEGKEIIAGINIGGSNFGYMTGDFSIFGTYQSRVQDYALQIIEDFGDDTEKRWAHAQRMEVLDTPIDVYQYDEELIEHCKSLKITKERHINRGVDNESVALKKYQSLSGHKLCQFIPNNATFENARVFDGQLHGTPDAITLCGIVIEVKCPEVIRSVCASYVSQLKSYMRILESNSGCVAQYCVSDETLKLTHYSEIDCCESFIKTRAEAYKNAKRDILESIYLMTNGLM